MAGADLDVAVASAPDPGPAGDRPTRVRYVVLAAACVLAVITYVQRAGFGSIATEMLRDLRLDVRHLTYFMAAFMVAYGVFEVPWGRLGDRYGARSLLPAVAAGGSVMTAFVALVPMLPAEGLGPLAALFGLRFAFGAFQAGTFPILARVVADWMPTTARGSAQGAIWMASRAGGMLAPLLVVFLFHRLGHWRWPPVVGAALGIAWAGVFWAWYRNRPGDAPRVNAAERALIERGRAKGPKAGHDAAPWGRMLRSANVWALCGMYGFLGFSGNFFLFLLPNYLETVRGFDKNTSKWLAAVPFACGMAACIAGGWLSDAWIRRTGDRRLGRRLVGASGQSLAAAAMLATLWARDPLSLGIVLGLAFTGNDLSMGPAWAAASDIGERHAGTLAGLMNMTTSLMAALAGIVFGQMLHRGHTALPFVMFAASYLLGALCWLRVDVTETLAGPEAEPLSEQLGDRT